MRRGQAVHTQGSCQPSKELISSSIFCTPEPYAALGVRVTVVKTALSVLWGREGGKGHLNWWNAMELGRYLYKCWQGCRHWFSYL